MAQPPTAPSGPAPISITVDGTDLALPTGATAMEQGGRVLVPLRGIFERLGAKVKFDAPTHSISATKDTISVFLQLGNTTAVVNGAPRILTAPAQIVGGTTTMVPLRFVSEALGAKVKWNPATRTVRIFTAEALAANPNIANTPGADAPPATALAVTPAAPPADGAPTGATTAPATTPPVVPPATTPAPVAADATITGTLVSVDTSAMPSVTVHVEMPTPNDLPITLTPDARILDKRGDEAAVVRTLANLRPGDQVVVRRNAAGLATDIEADYLEVKGAIKTVAPGDNGATHLTLADDSALDLTATTPLTLGGNAAAGTDLKPMMSVTVRENPTSKLPLAVAALLPEVKISSLTLTGTDKTLTAADTVDVTLVGTPGGKATVTVANLPGATALPLTESATTPGTYTGSIAIAPGFAAEKAAVTGTLAIDPVTAPVFTAPATLTFDSQPPTFANITPADQTTVTDRRPDITGDISDQGTGIDPTHLKFVVNDMDVTAQVKLDKNHFVYHPTADLTPGSTKVTVTIKDMAGNVAQNDWLFSIIPAENPIKVVTVSAPEGDALQATDVVNVRAEALPGGTAKFTIGPNALISGMMNEIMPGIYTGSYTVQKGDSLAAAPVTVTLTPAGGGAAVTRTALQKVTLSAGPPVAPVIDQPLEGASTGAYMTVSGHGTPNSTVRLTISYSGKVVVLKKAGNLSTLDLPVGHDGTWTTELITLETGNVGSVTFVATAITVLKDGELSAPATVRFKK